MGFLDKVKQQATQVGQKAQEGVSRARRRWPRSRPRGEPTRYCVTWARRCTRREQGGARARRRRRSSDSRASCAAMRQSTARSTRRLWQEPPHPLPVEPETAPPLRMWNQLPRARARRVAALPLRRRRRPLSHRRPARRRRASTSWTTSEATLGPRPRRKPPSGREYPLPAWGHQAGSSITRGISRGLLC